MAARHPLDTCAKTLALWRHSWLQSTSFLADTKSINEDLSFEGDGFFSFIMDATLQEMDKSIKASKALSFSQPLKSSRPWS